MFSNYSKKIISGLLVAIVLFATVSAPIKVKEATAQGPVPIGTSFDYNITMQHVKDYITDKLAYQAAGLMLQAVTTSVVNWINSGFDGSPSFLSNPQAFFLDAADQITGAFIANTGVLAELCSPFNIDIRLSLAISAGIGVGPNKRYACTLSTVVKNAQNAKVNVSGNVNADLNFPTDGGTVVIGPDGRPIAYENSVEGFMGGDFSQGGWSAFRTMAVEPQNNPYGAYFVARSDLTAQVVAKQNSIQADINLGQGFLSSKKCNEVPQAQWNPNGGEVVAGAQGTFIYKNCTIQTPGSVIGSALNKSLGIPQDRLNMADSINKIANALFSQLITQVLMKGLGSASKSSGNVTAGIAVQIQQQQNQPGVALSGKDQLIKAIDQFEASSGQNTVVANREQALSALQAPKSAYINAMSCFQQLASSTPNAISYAQQQVEMINSAIATKIAPLEVAYQNKLNSTKLSMQYLTDLRGKINAATTATQLQGYNQEFNTFAAQNATNLTVTAESQADLVAAQTQSAALLKDAQVYQERCGNYNNPNRPF